MTEKDFSWNDTDSVVLESVAAIAVYSNPKGNIVIRQQGDDYQQEDDVIVIPLDRVEYIISAIKREAELVQQEIDNAA